MRITVNGASVYVTHERLGYKEIVALAKMPGPPESLVVTYERGVIPQHGTMEPGDIVKAQASTIFTVAPVSKTR